MEWLDRQEKATRIRRFFDVNRDPLLVSYRRGMETHTTPRAYCRSLCLAIPVRCLIRKNQKGRKMEHSSQPIKSWKYLTTWDEAPNRPRHYAPVLYITPPTWRPAEN